MTIDGTISWVKCSNYGLLKNLHTFKHFPETENQNGHQQDTRSYSGRNRIHVREIYRCFRPPKKNFVAMMS